MAVTGGSVINVAFSVSIASVVWLSSVSICSVAVGNSSMKVPSAACSGVMSLLRFNSDVEPPAKVTPCPLDGETETDLSSSTSTKLSFFGITSTGKVALSRVGEVAFFSRSTNNTAFGVVDVVVAVDDDALLISWFISTTDSVPFRSSTNCGGKKTASSGKRLGSTGG